MVDFLAKMGKEKDSLPYLVDGVVVKVNEISLQQKTWLYRQDLPVLALLLNLPLNKQRQWWKTLFYKLVGRG